MDAATRVMGGRFELATLLGSGGVGTVWRALDREDGQAVALKLLHPHLASDPVVCARFRREADIARGLAHPSVVRAFEFFEDPSGLYFSMELCEGSTLKEVVLAQGQLTVEETLRIARGCLAGLGAAHAAGVIHRDFKPQNVMVGPDGAVKLLDFGFARVASAAGLTTKSLVLCTPDYAAPEVIAGRAVDARADLYALGVVLYECLTGQLPYKGATPFELLSQHLNAPAPSPSALRQDTPVWLADAVQRLMAKHPEDRFATCEAAAAALMSRPAEAAAQRAMARPGGLCPLCGELREPLWPLCPACGGTDSGHAAGAHLVVLTRAPPDSAGAILEVAQSVGAVPRRALEQERRSVTKGLPRVLVKGVGEPLARLMRERLQAQDVQVELRKYTDNNSDLLHRANTPGYLFALGLLLPWGFLVFSTISWYAEARPIGSLSLGWVLGAVLVGPALGAVLLKKTHLLLRALARMPSAAEAPAFPEALVLRYRSALARVKAPALRGTLRRLFERTLVLHGAAHRGPAHARLLLEGPCRDALRLVELGVQLAVSAQESQDRLAQAGEPELWTGLEALRARLQREPQEAATIQAAIAQKQAALEQVGQLEAEHARVTQKLLRVATGLEQAAVGALVVSARPEASVSMELSRLGEEVALASEVAAELARPTSG